MTETDTSSASSGRAEIGFRILSVVIGVLMIGWGGFYWHVSSEFDACTADVQARNDRVQAKIGKNRSTIEEIARLNKARSATP